MKTLNQFITEALLGTGTEINGFCILKPGFIEHNDDWLAMLKNNNWDVIQKANVKLTLDEAKDLYSPHKDKDFYNDLCKYMTSDECVCAVCHKDCNDPIKDMKGIKNKCRDAWGIDEMRNAMHSSDSLDNVKREKKICLK